MSEADNRGEQRSIPPWTEVDLVFILVLWMLVPTLVHQGLEATGWFERFYGAELVELAKGTTKEASLTRYRLTLWSNCLGGLTLALWIIGHVCLFARASLADMGLTGRNLGRNLLAGLLFALVFAPGAYAIQALALIAVRALGGSTEQHPFTDLGTQPLYPIEWVLLVAAAVVVAPLTEELLFRGLLQPWVITNQPASGFVVFLMAFSLALVLRLDHIRSGLAEGKLTLELLPVLFVVALLPAYVGLAGPEWTKPRAGLFATAVFFAWIHVRVWPTPVPLLWLALGLGWLRWQSGSLVGPILLHGLFNSIAVVMLLWKGINPLP